MKKILLLGTALALIHALAACGQKGPLYLPDTAPTTTTKNANTAAPQQP
jgi:predicted small lipoprotein YifL